MSLVNRRHFLQLSASSLLATAWGVGCAPDDAAVTPSAAQAPTTLARASTTTSGTTTPVGNRLRIALSVLPNTLDPAAFNIIEAYPFGFAVYDALVWVDTALTPQPMLAESWQTSTNRLRWDFHLRRGVTFHHGKELKAEDVVYTLERLRDPRVNSVLQPLLRFIDTVEPLDDYTVRFALTTPRADLPLLLASPQARILARDYPVERLLSQPSGTGPFVFAEMLANEWIRYTRNPNYWAAREILVDELYHVAIPSIEAQVAALVNGEIDLLLDVPINQIDALTANPDTQVIEVASGRYQTLAMRVTVPPFNDVRVRQALKACTDRAALHQQVMDGRGAIGHDQPVAPISPFVADLPEPTYDLALARQRLEEAGFADGLRLELITSAAAPGMVELAYAFQAMAKPAGIEIEVVEIKVPSDIYLDDYWGRAPFYVSFTEFHPSIYATFATAYQSWSPWNDTGWSSKALDNVLDSAHRTTDPKRRQAIYKKAQELIMKEGATIIPYFQPVFSAMRTAVQGFQPHPAGWVDLRNVQVKG